MFKLLFGFKTKPVFFSFSVELQDSYTDLGVKKTILRKTFNDNGNLFFHRNAPSRFQTTDRR